MQKIKEEDIYIGLKSDKPVLFDPFKNNPDENFNTIIIGKPGKGMAVSKKEEIKEDVAHKHSFDIGIGKYYKLYHSSMGYRFDRVLIFERKKCFCGECKDFEISRNNFRPRFLHKKDKFIESIKKKGIGDEFEVNLRTNNYGKNIEKILHEILIG